MAICPCNSEVSSSFVASGCVPLNIRNCYIWQKVNRKFMIQLNQAFQPRWTTMRCVLFLSNCPADPLTILSVEYPKLLVAPRKHVQCRQLDQLYPQSDEPAFIFFI
ncbi:Proteasome component (PCI) domain protein [Trifolium repens]|nr:Proteasome component (PCI) domain protein [Trifolium repens]